VKPYTLDQAEADLTAAMERDDLLAALAAADHIDRTPPRTKASTVEAALWYASQGLPVFPIQPGAKVPYPRFHWRDEATTNAQTIRDWFGVWPDANLALATGTRVDVIDFDGPQAHQDWGRTFQGWQDAEVNVLGTVSTPRPGGLHVYVPATGAGNRAGFCGPHVDYRGEGGYVLVPPSRTDVGDYRWLRPLQWEGYP